MRSGTKKRRDEIFSEVEMNIYFFFLQIFSSPDLKLYTELISCANNKGLKKTVTLQPYLKYLGI